jgi:hypothetical protein
MGHYYMTELINGYKLMGGHIIVERTKKQTVFRAFLFYLCI